MPKKEPHVQLVVKCDQCVCLAEPQRLCRAVELQNAV